MIRYLHRWPALIALVFILALAISGAVLAVFPALDAATTPRAQQGQTVAELVAKAVALHPALEQIHLAPSGKITLWWFEGNAVASAVFDPVAGRDMGSADINRVQQWTTEFHRALFLDDTGRIVKALAATAMLMLTITGSALIAARMGGLRRWFALYMPALVALRWNPDLKKKYNRLRAAGKPAKVAIVAVMRNLIEIANALIKANRKWTPKAA